MQLSILLTTLTTAVVLLSRICKCNIATCISYIVLCIASSSLMHCRHDGLPAGVLIIFSGILQSILILVGSFLSGSIIRMILQMHIILLARYFLKAFLCIILYSYNFTIVINSHCIVWSFISYIYFSPSSKLMWSGLLCVCVCVDALSWGFILVD